MNLTTGIENIENKILIDSYHEVELILKHFLTKKE